MLRTLPLLTAFCLLNSLLAQPGWTVYNQGNGGLGTGPYSGVAIDGSGNIWAAGGYLGVSKFNGSAWTHYTTFNSELPTSSISELAIDNTGRIWASHYLGISVLDGADFILYNNSNTPLPGEEVYTLNRAPDGKMWIASKDGVGGARGVTVYDGTTWTNLTDYPSQLVSADFNRFAFTSTGTVWMATQPAMTKYENDAFTFYPTVTTQLWIANSVAVDEAGTMWAGGFDGLLKYNGTWNFQENVSFGFPENTIYYCMLVDGNYLWMGTSQGFIKYNRTTGTIVAIYDDSNSPLEANGVIAVKKDIQGNLWLATTVGVVKMDPTAVVGMEEATGRSPGLRVYPNPADGAVTLLTTGLPSGNVSVRITDITGQVVHSERRVQAAQTTLDLTGLAAGIYQVSVADERGATATERVVVR